MKNVGIISALYMLDGILYYWKEVSLFFISRKTCINIQYFIAKLSYEDFSPAMLADSKIQCSRPKQIMTLQDLYPYINTLHGDNHTIHNTKETLKQTAHASH